MSLGSAVVSSPQTPPILQVRGLKTYFPIRKGVLQRTVGYVKAIDGVDFDVLPGETLGLVGESGCGKTTVGRSILRLIPATEGSVVFDGQEVFGASGTSLRALRRQMQIVFQDPGGSLNPRMRVAGIVGEPLLVHGIVGKDRLRHEVEQVPISPLPHHRMTTFPAKNGLRGIPHPISYLCPGQIERFTQTSEVCSRRIFGLCSQGHDVDIMSR